MHTMIFMHTKPYVVLSVYKKPYVCGFMYNNLNIMATPGTIAGGDEKLTDLEKIIIIL